MRLDVDETGGGSGVGASRHSAQVVHLQHCLADLRGRHRAAKAVVGAARRADDAARLVQEFLARRVFQPEIGEASRQRKIVLRIFLVVHRLVEGDQPGDVSCELSP
jgi:hypothetical protein